MPIFNNPKLGTQFDELDALTSVRAMLRIVLLLSYYHINLLSLKLLLFKD